MEVLTWVAEQEDKSKRIDVFVTEQIEQIEQTISRSRIQKLIEKQYLKVNENSVKSNYKLRERCCSIDNTRCRSSGNITRRY